MLDLKGKNVLFVGGFGGIGLESVKSFLTRKVAFMYILDNMEDYKIIESLQKDHPSTMIAFNRLDVTDSTEIENKLKEVVKAMKYIDVLVNGAGICVERNVEKTIAVNLVGLINTTLKALDYMDKSQGGRGGVIVNIASVLGLEPAPGVATYTASKHGVIGFTRSLSHDLYYKRTGVIHMAVCPGATKTPLLNTIDGTFDYSQELITPLLTCKSQTPKVMGELLVKTVEISKNGGIFICDLGTLREVEFKKHWDIEF
ncbi:hypothetical protein ACFFRR_011195 [Megaselia abdita]